MVDPAGVPPIAEVEDRRAAQEDIGLVYQRLAEGDMSSCCLLVGGLNENAVAHNLDGNPAAADMQDVKGLPSVP